MSLSFGRRKERSNSEICRMSNEVCYSVDKTEIPKNSNGVDKKTVIVMVGLPVVFECQSIRYRLVERATL